MKYFNALLLSSALFATGQAVAQDTAATLQDINGKVLMNKGSGLVSGKPGAALLDGDRIVTLDKSNARILFSDGCELVLEENKILVIDMKLGCKAAVLASEPAPGAVAGVGSVPAGLWIGGIVGAGGALLVLSGNNDSDNRPISAQ